MRCARMIGQIFGLAVILSLAPLVARAQTGTYTVQLGDSLKSIAADNGVTVDALIQANHLSNPDMIWAGQQLVIPSADGSQPSGTAPSGTAPSWTVGASQPSTNTGAPADAGASAATANANRPAPTTVLPDVAMAGPANIAAQTAASRPEGYYTIQPGDTLDGIALRFGTTTAELAQTNDIYNLDLLTVGAELIMPGSEAAAAAASRQTAINATTSKPSSYNKPGGGKPVDPAPTRFVASISKQHCWLYENNVSTGDWPCSTGRRGYETPTGYYTIQSKISVAYGSTWGWNMPYWLGIYQMNGLENGIHGLPYNKAGYRDWANRIGTPVSFGCIVLKDTAARQVFTAAALGMQVIIQK
jgi:LysM repeat protein